MIVCCGSSQLLQVLQARVQVAVEVLVAALGEGVLVEVMGVAVAVVKGLGVARAVVLVERLEYYQFSQFNMSNLL